MLPCGWSKRGRLDRDVGLGWVAVLLMTRDSDTSIRGRISLGPQHPAASTSPQMAPRFEGLAEWSHFAGSPSREGQYVVQSARDRISRRTLANRPGRQPRSLILQHCSVCEFIPPGSPCNWPVEESRLLPCLPSRGASLPHRRRRARSERPWLEARRQVVSAEVAAHRQSPAAEGADTTSSAVPHCQRSDRPRRSRTRT